MSMHSDRHIWLAWAERIRSWGLAEWVASLLEAIGPLGLLGAQALYVTQPVLQFFVTDNRLQALADLLEEPEETQGFVRLLREGGSR